MKKLTPEEIDGAIDCLEMAEIQKNEPSEEADGPPRPRRNMARPRQFTV